MYRYPVNYIAITQYFTSKHRGLDLGWNSKHGGKNQPIYAVADGVIYSTNDNDTSGKSWGNYVKINHGGNKYTLYGHLKNGIKVKKGQNVKQGDLLGYMGNTGKSSGNHLHYECYEGGASTSCRVDPLTRTYVYPNQTISANKDAIKGLRYYTPIAQPVERDENKDQFKVLATELRVRKGHSTSSDKIGVIETGKIYNYYEMVNEDGYDWYKIADNQWVANNGKYLEIYPRKEEEDKEMIEQLQKQLEDKQAEINQLNAKVEELKLENGNLDTINKALQEENKGLINDIESFKEVYHCEKTDKYEIEIKLYENEKLYVK